MALQMATNITPDALNGTGGGVFDATDGLNVSWQVNGESPLLAYKIVIQENNSASTEKYNSGKITLSAPFYGVNYKGEAVFFEANAITAAALSAAGISNGNDYKMVITQWWGAADTDSVTQYSAAYIQARVQPTIEIDTIPSPVTSHIHTFTAEATLGTGDSIEWIRWQIAYTGNDDNPIYDSGDIYGTSELRCEIDTLMTGKAYDIRVDIQTQSGQTATSGWEAFTVSYTVSPPDGSIEVSHSCNRGGILVEWDGIADADGFSLYRMDVTLNKLNHIADFGSETLSFIDYGVVNNHVYYYQLYKMIDGEYTTSALTSEEISPCRWDYLVVCAVMKADGAYHAQVEYQFGLNVESGTVGNNNEPKTQRTFTKYPNWQADTSLYNSGTLTAFIGKIDPKTNQYISDTAMLADEIKELSLGKYTMFLKDRKGNLRNIKTNGAITSEIEDEYPNQATKVTIPWVEVDTADDVVIIATAEDGLFNIDQLTLTTVSIDAETGVLSWTYPDNYISKEDNGSVLEMDGVDLVQKTRSVRLSMANSYIVRGTEELFTNNKII